MATGRNVAGLKCSLESDHHSIVGPQVARLLGALRVRADTYPITESAILNLIEAEQNVGIFCLWCADPLRRRIDRVE